VYSGFINDLGSFTLRQGYYANVNVNVNLHSALLHSASNALRAPSTAETDASSVGDRSWWCSVLDRTDHCQVRCRRSDYPWQTPFILSWSLMTKFMSFPCPWSNSVRLHHPIYPDLYPFYCRTHPSTWSRTVSRQPLTRSSSPSLLESSAWSPTW